jgi:general secretion pathway protein D
MLQHRRESGPSAGAQSPAERPLTLTSDEGTNTLIAVGEPRLLAQIEALLKTLDVRQPQVMLEVLMVTLSEGQTLSLGAEIEKFTIAGDARIRLSSLFGLSTRNPAGNLIPSAASGFTGSVLSPGDFSIVIQALQTLTKGHSLSVPKLLVGNNQQASLDSVTMQPYASLNATNTVSTTSYGGSADAGTTVSIKPQIAEGDHLVLEYSVSLSSFVGSAAASTLPPPKQQNKVQSAATIPDGYTVVVGGIELENDSKSVSQVPLLSQIPLLGEAFKSRSKTSSRSRFYVFIRANILRGRGFEDLKYISGRDVAKAGVDDGLPVVEPRVIK